MADQHTTSHDDIIRAVGRLEGKIEGIIDITNKHIDLSVDRMNRMDKEKANLDDKVDSKIDDIYKVFSDNKKEFNERLVTLEKKFYAWNILIQALWAISLVLAKYFGLI